MANRLLLTYYTARLGASALLDEPPLAAAAFVALIEVQRGVTRVDLDAAAASKVRSLQISNHVPLSQCRNLGELVPL